ncbi:MAG: TonB family protein [Treponema sp.]
MTTPKTNGLAAAAIFLSASILHILIIAAVFISISPEQPPAVQTQFVMHSPPQPAPPAAPRRQPVEKPKQKPVEKKAVPAPSSIPDKQSAPAEETAPSDIEPEQQTGNGSATAENSTQPPAIDFKALIIQRIAEKKIYPKAARKRGQEGSVTIMIIVLKSGQLAQADIISPSSYQFLNEAAIASIRAAAPFPLGDTAPEQIELTITLEYRLDG